MRVRAQHAQMIQHAIAVMFQINEITPLKAAWVAITLANVLMMLWVAWRSVGSPWTFWNFVYFLTTAFFSILQGAPHWDIVGEISISVISAIWVACMLPKHSYGRIFALSIGLVVTCVLMLAVPPPWAGYDPAMYHTRLYSTAAFLGVALGSALMTRNPSTMLAVPWFMAVLIAGSQRGFDRWVVGIYTNLIWSFCLICWLVLARRADRVASLMPDAPGDYQRSSRSLP